MTILDPDRRALLVNDRPALSILLLAVAVQVEGGARGCADLPRFESSCQLTRWAVLATGTALVIYGSAAECIHRDPHARRALQSCWRALGGWAVMRWSRA
jgi:hypothetical protein